MLRKLRRLSTDPQARMRLAGRIRHPYWRRRFDHFGAGAVLVRPQWVMGSHKISIGTDSWIHPGAWLSAERPSWRSDGPTLVIGPRVVMRQNCTVSCAERVTIEADVTLAGHVLVIDSDHTWLDGRVSIVANRLVTAPVRVGRGTWLAEGVRVLRGSDIGVCSIVAANSVVRGAFPDFSVIAGAPARVVGSSRAHMPKELTGELRELAEGDGTDE